ncbi:MAG: hypothetical protein BEN18_00110 [Epulopiscium sp. Nuni2H_MBin001]|nr:MAG: hypothetical protein BEN18_00110 [Epulopiscium sp. Nuni2H_MBin001]
MINLLFVLFFLIGCSNNEVAQLEEFEYVDYVEYAQEDDYVTNEVLSLNTTSNKSDHELRLAMHTPKTLNPIYNMDETVDQVMHLIFDTLVNIETDGNVTTNLAEYWSVNTSDNSITIVLRDDVYWHDGQLLQADDVVYTIGAIKAAPDSIYKVNVDNMSYALELSPNTVQIFYNQPFSGMLQTLFIPILPQHIYDVPYEQAAAIEPVGSGPFYYESSVLLKSLSLARNLVYFKGAPSITNIEVTLTPDHEATLSAFEQDLIDVIYTEVMDWGKYTKDKSANIYAIPTQKYEFIGINFSNPSLSKLGVREALLYGLDRESLVNIYYLGQGTVTDTPVSPNNYLYDNTLSITKYDRETARLLLAKEGFEYDKELQFKLLVNKNNLERLQVAQGIARTYSEVGINIVIEEVDVETFTKRVYSGNYELFLGGWQLSYIPDLTFAFHSEGEHNFINYNNSEMDVLLGTAFRTHPSLLKDVYSKLQQFIIQDIPYVSLFFKNGALITKPCVKGTISPDPLNIFNDIHLWEVTN